MSFVESQGALALASRLKTLSDRCYDAVDQIYREHGSALQSRWFPLLRLLQQQGPQTIGDAARALEQTHSAVSQLATRLVRDGWLASNNGESDGRQRVLSLTAKAQTELKRAQPLWQVLRDRVEDRLAGTGVDLLQALSTLEASLVADPLPAEVLAHSGRNSVAAVRIVAYSPARQADFYRLNAEWLSKYHAIEPIDHAVLSDPETHILAPGGAIFFAVLGDEVLGTCALMPESPGVYELTKMAVTERRQGLGLGRKLMVAAIAEFRRLGGTELFLESSRKLQPALKLYASVGFEMQAGIKPGTHYQRADVYMIFRG